MKKIFTIICLLLSSWQVSNAQWAEQTSTLTTQLYSVSAVDDNNAWVCGAAGRVIRTTNGGTNWINATGTGIPTSLDLYNIFGIDANTALVTGSNTAGYVYRTIDGGTTWTQVFTQAGGFLNGIWMTTPLTGLMTGDPVGSRWSLWRTINGGLTWDSTGMYVPQAGGELGWNNSLFVLGTNIWYGTDNSRIYYSATGGLSFTAQTKPNVDSYSIWFNTPTQGISGGGVIEATSNSGTNWTVVAGTPGTGNYGGVTGNLANYWAVRSSGVIYRSTNNGANFTTEYTAPSGEYAHITKARTGNRLWAIRDAGGISTSSGSVGITTISGELPSDYSLAQNYPNPFNPTTNIRFAVPVNGIVKVTVYDALGKEVAALVNETKSAGTYEVNFDASKLHSGIYFYTIQANGFTDTKKMMLVK